MALKKLMFIVTQLLPGIIYVFWYRQRNNWVPEFINYLLTHSHPETESASHHHRKRNESFAYRLAGYPWQRRGRVNPFGTDPVSLQRAELTLTA